MNWRVHARTLWLGALLWTLGCEPGKTHILGRLPEDGDDRDADREHDESVDRDAGEGGDAALVPCESRDDCTTRGRPYCSDYLGYCVACTRDWHCGDTTYWYCRDSNGTCVDERSRD